MSQRPLPPGLALLTGGLATLILGAPVAPVHAQAGTVLDGVLIAEGLGGFGGPTSADKFGESVCVIGDVDGDDIPDLAVGAPQTFDGPDLGVGAVWILFMEEDGTVRDAALIDAGSVPFPLEYGDRFGSAVAPAGDLDGDSIPDLWVGAYGDDDGFAQADFTGPGALYGLLLDKTGKAIDFVKISAANDMPTLASNDAFGFAVANVGDHFGDGHDDLLVGAPLTFIGPAMEGAAWLLDMGPGAKVDQALRLSSVDGGQTPVVSAGSLFGAGLGALGDLDGDGHPDFAVGAPHEDVLGPVDGALWVYFMGPGGAVLDLHRIAAGDAGFGAGGPGPGDRFGRSVVNIGDIDQDGDDDLLVGANTGGTDRHGALWALRIDTSAAELVEGAELTDDDDGFLPFGLSTMDNLGTSLAPLGDWNGDGTQDVVAGIPGWDPAGGGITDEGAVAVLFLDGPTFIDLGFPLAGSTSPSVSGGGSLDPGALYSILLVDGPPSGVAHAVIGFSGLFAPFKGGTLVPDADLILFGYGLSHLGSLTLLSTWPTGIPAGFETWLQFWMPDAGAPLGFSATNGLKLIAGS